MINIKRLVQTSELRTEKLSELARNSQLNISIFYDKAFDALMLLFIPNDQETVVHYTDGDVALLYLPDTLEVVGLHIEDFESKFLQSHEAVRRVWRLSETGVNLQDYADLIFAAEQLKPQVAREVIKATAEWLGEPGAELAAALA
jgi:hypothetical protein